MVKSRNFDGVILKNLLCSWKSYLSLSASDLALQSVRYLLFLEAVNHLQAGDKTGGLSQQLVQTSSEMVACHLPDSYAMPLQVTLLTSVA